MNGSKKGSLLIVDDAEINRAVLSNLFADEYGILEAENGLDGLCLLHQNRASLCAVLLDVVMPKMDGLEVLRRLHHSGITQELPIFLITSDPGDEIIREAYLHGVIDVISKPVVPYIVRRRVDSVVELFQARRKLGVEIERQRDQLMLQTQQLAQMGMGMVEALATAIEFRSNESGEHVRRIHDITCYMLRGTPLGRDLTEEEIQLIGVAAITHDVGKISIPDAILNKPGRLTPEEYAIMKTHTVKGAELLSRIPQMRDHKAYRYARDIALHHHERWDGRGYPDGLVGDETPIWTQIVSLADVYDALVSRRCYKDALPVEEATRMILDGACGVFNPRLLEHFQKTEPLLRQLYQKQEEHHG